MIRLDLALTESRTLREQHMDRTEVLDKVKTFAFLSDGMYVTVEMAATYYEVAVDAIESQIRRDRAELDGDGLAVLTGDRLSAFKAESGYRSRAGSLTLISRRALLRLGMLLRDSEIAKKVRTYLLDTENRLGTTHPAIPQSFAEALQLAADQARLIEAQGNEIAELQPRAAQADHYRAANGLTAIGDFANDLAVWARDNHAAVIKHADVRDFLAELGLLIRGNTIRNNEPTADAQKRGLMRIKHSTFDTTTRGVQSKASARLTEKGCGYVWDRAVRRIAATGSLKPSTAIERTAS